jgi:hypothetical protein
MNHRHYRLALTLGAIVSTVAAVILPEHMAHHSYASSLALTLCWLWEG